MRAREAVAHAVVTLSEKGWGQRRISQELGIGRKVVRNILRRITAARDLGHSALPAPPRKRKSVLDAHAKAIDELLETYPDITGVRLHEELVKRGFSGSYTTVKDRLRDLRPAPKAKFVERFETAPGVQGQQDWSSYGLDFSDEAAQRVRCFSLILSYSRRHFIHFGDREDLLTLQRQHIAAGNRFGGLPHEILYDNQKAVVLRREAHRPIYNPKFLAFATHYGFTPRVLPPRKPEWKGKVERPFQYIEGNFLNARSFRNRRELNLLAERWMDETIDLHVHDTTRERPIDRFAREKDYLLPLPKHSYDTAEVGYRVVSDEAFIEWQDVRYSVPVTAILDLVVVRATENEIFIYKHDLALLATHERAPRGHRDPVIDRNHRPQKRLRHDVEALTARLQELGEAAHAFAEGVVRAHRNRGAHLANVLNLVERYNTEDLVRAIERAVRYRAFDSGAITRILATTASPRPLPSTEAVRAHRRLREAADALSITPRALGDYARVIDDDDEAR